ncbi:MAG: DUF2304 domain-containing protein [Propionibacteriaceae bacterium]|nr:DUF2304 domain-containing protein [Propionibacteriaceae bacterium]
MNPTLVIQILLVAAIVVAMVRLITHTSVRTRAWAKILGLLFTVFAVLVVIFPDWTGKIAHLVGVGRGTDLLLYCLVIVVLTSMINTSLLRQSEQRRFAKVVRQQVLFQARMEDMLSREDDGTQV